ncbi:DUF2380 domain-containing protein [Mesorhizobium sp. ANAO-SY3R2]|uniref:DUF2380 domain-containing protein n=1 Tax=Mesorhizobium sp. ANAO-SY3R2 TaxID=3166644 RepID=UPI0036729D66
MVRPTISALRVAVAVFMFLGVASSFAKDGQPIEIAVAQFYFVDTSGEVEDQKARHENQLRQFETELQKTLSADNRLEIAALPCGSDRCSLENPGIDTLRRQAKTANARYLLAGGIQKMSTLVGWAKITVFDLEDSNRVCDRLFTYRGDTEEAWRRAAEFGAKNVIKACFP